MRKKNGYTIVEIIVSMALIVTIMLYLTRSIIVLMNKNNDLLVYEEYTVFENSLLKDIYTDVEIVYESENFLGVGDFKPRREIKFKDINKLLQLDKSNRKIIYDGVIYELPDKVDFREEDGDIYSVSKLKKSTHAYYVITIYLRVNDKSNEQIQIVYQNKNDVDLNIEYDPNGGTITSGNSEQIAKFGDKLQVPSVTYGKNIFRGWFDKRIGGKQVNNDTVIEMPQTYYAQWTFVYDISYNMNQGYVGQKCADENGICSFSGEKQICYGKDVYICKILPNSTACTNDVFTDPISGASKSCYISPNPTTYNDESSDISLSNPSKTGYTFTGWTGSNGSTPQKSVIISKGSTGNKTYTANYSPNTYTVNLNNNNATTAGSSSTTATYDSSTLAKITKPQKKVTITYVNTTGATQSGGDTQKTYTLNGWYTSVSDGSKVASNSTTPALQASVSGYTNSSKQWKKTSESTLYAHWNPVTATLPTLTKEGNTCIWTTDNGDSKVASGGTWSFSSANSRTFTAVCSPSTHVLTYDSQGGSSCSSKNGTYGSKWGDLCSPTKTGNSFGGWYTGKNGSGTNITKDTTVSSSLVVYAKWVPATFTVQYVYEGDYSGCTGVNGATSKDWSNTATYGSNYTVESNWWNCPGWTFTGWADQTGGTSWTNWSGNWTYLNGSYGISNNKLLLNAIWTPNKYTVHYLYPDVTGCTSSYGTTWDDSAYYSYPYYIQENWWSCPGYEFTKWKDDTGGEWSPGTTWTWDWHEGSICGGRTCLSNKSVTLKAQWKKVSSGGGGSSSGSQCKTHWKYNADTTGISTQSACTKKYGKSSQYSSGTNYLCRVVDGSVTSYASSCPGGCYYKVTYCN